ncbi:MAG: Lrp/AsnC family transcriptional regulator [Hyphomicrobiales bacterium]
MQRNLDAIDKKLLSELQRNGRISVVDLASRVNLTKTPCSERIKKLEVSGVISGYCAHVDAAKVHQNHVTIVHVIMAQSNGSAYESFCEAVRSIPEIQSCMMIAGSFDYMLKVRTRDITEFRSLLGRKISKLPNIEKTHSFTVLETVKDSDFIDVTI